MRQDDDSTGDLGLSFVFFLFSFIAKYFFCVTSVYQVFFIIIYYVFLCILFYFIVFFIIIFALFNVLARIVTHIYHAYTLI